MWAPFTFFKKNCRLKWRSFEEDFKAKYDKMERTQIINQTQSLSL